MTPDLQVSAPPATVLARLTAQPVHPLLAGLDQISTIRRNDRGITLRARRRGEEWSVVIKLYLDTAGLDRARRLHDLHRFAWQRCNGQTAFRVPEPLGLVPGLPGYAMRHVRGRAAADTVKWTLFGRQRIREELLVRAAGWLRAFHAGAETARVAPKLHLNRLIERQAVRGGIDAAFATAFERLREGAGRLGRFEFPMAVGHGDFNLHNLIIDGDVTWSMDFGGAGARRPVTFDIACCLFYLEFRDGWTGGDRAGSPGGFNRRAVEIFAQSYPDLEWDSAETAWLLLHHQLSMLGRPTFQRRWGHMRRMAANCQQAAETLAERLAAHA